MRILLALLICIPAMATTSGNPFSYYLNTASTNLTATFPASPQLSGPTTRFASVDVVNTTGSPVEVNCSQTTVPTSTSGAIQASSFSVPAGTGYSTPINGLLPYPMVNVCWVRSISGTISSGIVSIVGWGY